MITDLSYKNFPDSGKNLDRYYFCDFCFRRLFSKKFGLKSHKKLGNKSQKYLRKKNKDKCYICKNLFANLGCYIDKMEEISNNYRFSSFLVGAILRPSTIDKDDFIRSKFKLPGIDSIKTEITREIGKDFHRKTKKKVDFQSPDLTFTINFKNESVDLKSKPIFLFGRYVKTVRGIPQKQKPCNNCKGKGCSFCKYHGITEFASVEGRLFQIFFEKFGINQQKITWIGGEDKSSLVSGNGRPFFVKLIDPKVRKPKLPKILSKNEIKIYRPRIIENIPKKPVSFRSKINLSIFCKKNLESHKLRKLKTLPKTPITVSEFNRKKVKKNIYDLKYKKILLDSLKLEIIVDGGLPIKRFVNGVAINPNLSDILDNNCKCKTFDFQEITLAR